MGRPHEEEDDASNGGEYAVGSRIPGTPFTVVQVVGRGGHATVYDVENSIGKRLVVKVIHRHLAARGDFAHRIEEEARTLVQLEHPNIVAVYDLGITNEENGRPFIVMERLNGKNGREILQEVGRLEVRHAIDIGIDVCAALATAHAKKVVHQDIKPDNIFIHVGLDGRPVTKLVDFGIVRMLDRPQDKGIFEGTILYAAPEQLRFEGVTAKTDLYAVGLLLFELMTGVRPFPDLDDAPSASAAVQMRLAHVAQPAPSLSQWMLVPGDLEKLIQQCLEASPDARPESAARLAESLRVIRRRMANAPQKPQMRTEATLLGAVAEVRGGGGAPTPGAATATFAPAAPGGRFGQVNNADARIAKGVLTSEQVQSGATQRIPSVHPKGRGRFADALQEDANGDRTSDAPTSAPPEMLEAERSPSGTLDPTVPTSHVDDENEPPRRRRGARTAVGVAVAASSALLLVGLVVRLHASSAPSQAAAIAPSASVATPVRSTAEVPSTPSTPPPPPPAPAESAPPQAAVPTTAAAQAPAAAPSATARPDGAPTRSKRSGGTKPHDSMADWLEPDKPGKPTPKPKSSAPATTLESF